MVATFTQPNFTTQSAAVYKANIDGGFAVHHRLAGPFAAHQQDVGSPAPDLSVRLDAGAILYNGTLTEVAAQTVSGFTIPSAGQHRIDRVVIDVITGVASRVAGTAVTGSPSATPPAIPAGKVPNCQVLITSADTVIANSMITDERPPTLLAPASDTVQGAIEIATQAEQEAGSDTTKAVTPGRQHFHPSAAKSWGRAGTNGSVVASYQISSANDDGVGQITWNYSTAFSSGDFGAFPSVQATANNLEIRNSAQTTSSTSVVTTDAGVATDPSAHNIVAFGDR